ncbi:MAG: glycerol dehydrogenase [Bacteroidia bacterium]|nr:glycerol dehydrogenase [Bacteroidia bacterium]
MFIKAVFPAKYIQGQGVLHELPDLVKILGSNGLILASPTVKEKILPTYGSSSITEHLTVELFKGECCEDELNRLSHIIQRDHLDVIIGMGGGKTIDTAKITADRAGIPVIIVPTIAATDAPCSGCAVTYTPQGIFESVHYQKMNPAAVLVDMDVIAGAPTRFLVAGMGDALATWFEARSCEHTRSMNECGGLTTLAGLHIAKLCYETLLKYGLAAKIASEQHLVTPALNYITEANILLSGIGFESSGLAAAHAIHNGLTALEETHSFYHGEKVTFGVLAGLQLNAASREEVECVYSFCLEVGLPITLEDIGLKHPDRKKLMIAAEKACAPGEAIHHEPGIITPEKVVNAMLMADAFGKVMRIKQKH